MRSIRLRRFFKQPRVHGQAAEVEIVLPTMRPPAARPVLASWRCSSSARRGRRAHHHPLAPHCRHRPECRQSHPARHGREVPVRERLQRPRCRAPVIRPLLPQHLGCRRNAACRHPRRRLDSYAQRQPARHARHPSHGSVDQPDRRAGAQQHRRHRLDHRPQHQQSEPRGRQDRGLQPDRQLRLRRQRRIGQRDQRPEPEHPLRPRSSTAAAPPLTAAMPSAASSPRPRRWRAA